MPLSFFINKRSYDQNLDNDNFGRHWLLWVILEHWQLSNYGRPSINYYGQNWANYGLNWLCKSYWVSKPKKQLTIFLSNQWFRTLAGLNDLVSYESIRIDYRFITLVTSKSRSNKRLGKRAMTSKRKKTLTNACAFVFWF